MDYIKEYVNIIYEGQSNQVKINRKNDLIKLSLSRDNINKLTYKSFKIWKNYKMLYYDNSILKYNIDLNLISYNFDPKNNVILNYLKEITNLELDCPKTIHYLHSRKSLLLQQMKDGKTNKFIKNFLEYDKMNYIVNNRKSFKN